MKVKIGVPLERVAPLLCAGITTLSPLHRYKVKKGHKVAIVGLGGLGHMGVQFAKAMGAEVSVISTSPSKEADAKKLGAKHFVMSTQTGSLDALVGKFNFILDTVSAKHDLSPYVAALKPEATLVLVGASPEPNTLGAFPLIFGRKKVTGSLPKRC